VSPTTPKPSRKEDNKQGSSFSYKKLFTNKGIFIQNFYKQGDLHTEFLQTRGTRGTRASVILSQHRNHRDHRASFEANLFPLFPLFEKKESLFEKKLEPCLKKKELV
jgi:hypothetical protein